MCKVDHKWLEEELCDLNFELVEFMTNYRGKLKVIETLQRAEIEHFINGVSYSTVNRFVLYEVSGSLFTFINEFFKDNEEYLEEVLSKTKGISKFKVETVSEWDSSHEPTVIILNLESMILV